MRLFIAVTIPQNVKDELALAISNLRKGVQFTGAHPTWVKPENLHLTLAFLGNTSLTMIPEISSAMDSVMSGIEAFELKLSQVELFPSQRSPKVVAIGVHGKLDVLNGVFNRISDECRKLGFSLEGRPYRPHLTLARIKSEKGLAGLREVVRSHKNIKTSPFAVYGIALYQSQLMSDGPIYTVLHTTGT